MRSTTTVAVVVPLLFPLWACGGSGGGDDDPVADAAPVAPDMGPRGPCWSTEGSVPRGTIELGTGVQSFTPMPTQQPTEYGSQGGFDIQVNARMTGLKPGNLSDILDPGNPKTRFRAFFVDNGVSVNRGECAFRLAYKDMGNGVFELQTGTSLIYDVCFQAQGVLNHDVKIVLEILDADGGYASVEQIITPIEPIQPGWPDIPNYEPCPPPP